MTQASLFPRPPKVPAIAHSATSKAAAESIRPKVRSIETRVRELFWSLGAWGATDDELARVFPKLCPGTLRARRIALTRKGLVYDSHSTRKTQYGKSATVWKAR